MADVYVPRLRKQYDDEIRAKLIEKFGYTNPMQIPQLEKVVLNMGVGDAVGDSKLVKVAADELTKIAGQRVTVTKARKSIATFKLREGMDIGVKVTLRKQSDVRISGPFHQYCAAAGS